MAGEGAVAMVTPGLRQMRRGLVGLVSDEGFRELLGPAACAWTGLGGAPRRLRALAIRCYGCSCVSRVSPTHLEGLCLEGLVGPRNQARSRRPAQSRVFVKCQALPGISQNAGFRGVKSAGGKIVDRRTRRGAIAGTTTRSPAGNGRNAADGPLISGVCAMAGPTIRHDELPQAPPALLTVIRPRTTGGRDPRRWIARQ
jgi:hypothetical protein